MKSFFSNVLLQMNTRIDVLVLGLFWSDHIVGIYSFAATLAEGVYQLLVVLRTNYNPMLVRLTLEAAVR
jgi:O-antigen/teichoic acid export membrane protein